MAEAEREPGMIGDDLINLDASLAKFIANSLRNFADVTMSYPPQLKDGEWQVVLNQIADGLENWATFDPLSLDVDEVVAMEAEAREKLFESLELLKEYWLDLWS